MDKGCASSYVYAKCCGMLSKSFLGKNASVLYNAKNLEEIWQLVFKTPVPSIPEALLATQIEKDAMQRFVDQFISLIECYNKPPKYLVVLLQQYDLDNLKAIISALSLGEENYPHPVRLGKYELFDYTKWPSLKEITQNSPFDWINKVPELNEIQQLDFKIDLIQTKEFWKAINKVPLSIRQELKSCFIDYYSLKNFMWVLRLKVYYNMTPAQIENNLLFVTESADKSDPICKDALSIIEKPIDSFDEWKDTKFVKYLNPHEEGSVWKIDPLWIESKIRSAQSKKTFSMFHKAPLTELPLFMFFFLKLQEVNVIRASVEKIRLGAEINESMYLDKE